MKPQNQQKQFVKGTAERSCVDVGRMLGISESAVHKAEKNALRKIRLAVSEAADAEGVSVRQWLSS